MCEEAKANDTLQLLEALGVADNNFRKLLAKEQAVYQAAMTAQPTEDVSNWPRWLEVFSGAAVPRGTVHGPKKVDLTVLSNYL
jgi:hypothetical protein